MTQSRQRPGHRAAPPAAARAGGGLGAGAAPAAAGRSRAALATGRRRALARGAAGRGAGVALALAALAALATACQSHEYERPDRAEQVAEAEALLTPETFDTIAWVSDSARAFDGNNVFAARCRSCHGYLGEGDTEYARQHNIAVPSLVHPDWPYDDVPSVRRRIFTGHPAGMPTWGVAGITPREIDAVAYYISAILRPEVLGR